MRTVAKGAVAASIAAALLVAGGIGLVRTGGSPVRSTPIATSDVRADGSPGLNAALLGTGAALEDRIAALQGHLREAPTDASALAQLGIAYVTQARVTADPSWYPKAEGVLDEALRLGGDRDADALLGAGTLALARHDFVEALRLGRAARALNPYDADADGVIGDALLELGRYDDAFAAFQRMVDTKPQLAAYARVSYARELLGDIGGAVAAMRMAFEAAGSPSDAAWAAFQLGELEWTRGAVRAAEGWYDRGLGLDPDFVPNAAGLAKVAWASGDPSLAIERYADVAARYPAVEYVAALGDLYAVTGRDDLAAEQYAVVDATRTLQAENGVDVDLEVALFEADHGDTASALEAARAEWARRHSIHVADAYAWALHGSGDDRRAAAMARRALSLGTRNATFLFHAGMIERALGNDTEALHLLREALAINPHFSILHASTAERVVAELEAAR